MEPVKSENKHLSDKEISWYVNRESSNQEMLEKVERHIYIAKCQICKQKMEELRNLHVSLQEEAVNHGEEFLYDCIYTDKIDDFINKKLSRKESERLKEHLSDCEVCRELVAVYLKSGALSELEGKKDAVEKPIWMKVGKGLFQWGEILAITKEQSDYQLQCGGVSYRGNREDKDDDIVLKVCNEVDLPEKIGKIIITAKCIENCQVMVEPKNVKAKSLLLEFYDSKGVLLKSVDGLEPVTCVLTCGINKVIVNGIYEINLRIE